MYHFENIFHTNLLRVLRVNVSRTFLEGNLTFLGTDHASTARSSHFSEEQDRSRTRRIIIKMTLKTSLYFICTLAACVGGSLLLDWSWLDNDTFHLTKTQLCHRSRHQTLLVWEDNAVPSLVLSGHNCLDRIPLTLGIQALVLLLRPGRPFISISSSIKLIVFQLCRRTIPFHGPSSQHRTCLLSTL